MPKRGKGWLVLIYADGNNDLEPEIYQGFKAILAETPLKDMPVMIQLARAPLELVGALRPRVPTATGADPGESWVGTRRYILGSHDALPPLDVGMVNMADPATLYDFLLWGLDYHPAPKVMVIMSGHGGGFVGAMPDFTRGYPRIMGLAGLVQALDRCKQKTGRRVDLLVLDSCHMNMIEVWFEFALAPHQPVSYLLVPRNLNPLEGLPCHQLIRSIQNTTGSKIKLPGMLISLAKTINQNQRVPGGILIVNLAAKYHIRLKHALDQLAVILTAQSNNPAVMLDILFRARPGYPMINLTDLCHVLVTQFPQTTAACRAITKVLGEMILEPKINPLPNQNDLGPHIYLGAGFQRPTVLQHYYTNLLFARGSRWVHMLQGGKIQEPGHSGPNSNSNSLPPPLPIPRASLLALMMEHNPALTATKARTIQKQLGWWRIES